MTPLERPITWTGESASAERLSPTSPVAFQPQQSTPAPSVTAQLCPLPVVIAVKPLIAPVPPTFTTCTGRVESVSVPLPSPPLPFAPQQSSEPEASKAQAC